MFCSFKFSFASHIQQQLSKEIFLVCHYLKKVVRMSCAIAQLHSLRLPLSAEGWLAGFNVLFRTNTAICYATITYHARQSGQHAYLCSKLEDYQPTWNSRSASSPLLNRPDVNNVVLPVHFQFLHPLSGTRCSLGHIHLKLMPLS